MVERTCPQLTLVAEHEITLSGQTISYIVKRSTRAKHVRLEVRPENGLMVVVPQRYGIRQLPGVLKAKREWILSTLAGYREVHPLDSGKELSSDKTIPYLGRDVELVTRESPGNTESVWLERGRLVVSLRPASGSFNFVLERWYRMRARRLIKKRADELSARLGVPYGRLVIRGQRTRWGSCSAKGNLSINWRLMMAPEPVIDYVIIHELAHLKEMNHSRRFWQLVAEHCPRWREHRRWLKDHEAVLAAWISPQKRGD